MKNETLVDDVRAVRRELNHDRQRPSEEIKLYATNDPS